MTELTLARFRAIKQQNREMLVMTRVPILKPQIDGLKGEITVLWKKHKAAKKADKDHIRDAVALLYGELAPLEHEYKTLLSYGIAAKEVDDAA